MLRLPARPVLRLSSSPSTVASRSTLQSSSRSYASIPLASKPKKSVIRRVLSPIIVGAVVFYGASVPLGFYSLRYRDFLVETVPLGEIMGDYLDKLELSGAGGMPVGTDGKRIDTGAVVAGANGVKETELTRYAESKAKAEGWSVKKGEKADPVKANEEIRAKAEKKANELKEVAAAAKAKAGLKAQEARANIDAVVSKVEAKAEQAKDAVIAAVVAVEQAIPSFTPTSTPTAASVVAESSVAPAATLEVVDVPVVVVVKEPASTKLIYEQRPRELDATPLPAKKANNEVYSGPPLPIGFEPPPGFELPRPVSSAPKGSIKPAPTPIAPLPLVAPAVLSLATSEPVLGQLASTIDTLAKLVSNTSEIVSTNAAGVLKVAQSDIEKLASRLEAIKKEENAKLEASLAAQAKEYSNLLVSQEKDLIDRLDTQEEDWKKAFDDERKNLVSAYREKLEKELETQQEIINQRLREEVIAQGIELQRRWVREIKVRVEQERGGRLAKLEELEGGIRKLEKVTKENEEVISEVVRARKVFAAIKAVSHAVSAGLPFSHELAALQSLVAPTSPDSPTSLTSIALSTVPLTTSSVGISSFPTLASRFTQSVAPQLRRSAMLPEHGGIFAYLTSWVASNFLFQKEGWAEGEDVVSVVARASFWLSNKDLDLAAREINTLKGWPRTLAEDWLQAARRHLEVKLALEIAEADNLSEQLKSI